jgi:phage gp36-like protein
MPNFLKTYKFRHETLFDFDVTLIEKSGSSLQLIATTLVYSMANPSIVTKKSIPLSAINSFVPTVTTPTGTEIKYTLIKDGQDYYYNSGWIVSDGTYIKSNTLAEIQANIATFTTERTDVKIKVFLHSQTGAATPSISILSIGFTYSGYCSPDAVRRLLGGAGQSENIDDEDIIGGIEIADSQIDSYLSKYTLPLTTIPAQIRSYSAIIAAYNLYSNFEVLEGTTKSAHRVRYEKAMQELEAIHKGDKFISGLTKTDNMPSISTNDDYIEYEDDVTLQFENI